MTREASRITVLAFVALVGGCAESGPPRGSVQGRVTLDGQPVDGATIVFLPTKDTRGPAIGGAVKGGSYAIPAVQGPVVGWNRVEISGLRRKTGKMFQPPLVPPGVQAEETVEAIPARYNKESTLTVEVKAGKNQLDFPLKSGAE